MGDAAVQAAKVSRIFKAFDTNKTGGLSKAELLTFVARVNPTVKFTPVQLTAIADEVCLEYSEHVGKAGLTEEGLRAMYESGNGNVDDDYEALGFMVDEDNPEQVPGAPPAQEVAPSIAAENAAEAAAANAVSNPEKENVDVNEPGEAEAEPAARASWAGKLGKWAAALKPTPATVPPESEAAQKGCKSLEPQQQAANSKLGGVEKPAVPKLALGAAANAASDAWVIKAHTESSAAAASEVEARHAIVNIGNTLPAQTKTAEESIAVAKRELASYKQVKHEAAIRAVTAAKRALSRGADSWSSDNTEAGMAVVLDAVADAKRALSSHPLPDASQAPGAAESVAAAQSALAVVPTEYDDDGPMPPLSEALAAVEAAREALDRYPMVAEPGSPLPGSLSPGPKSHRIHITASPSHSYAPAAARKLDTDTHPNNAAHGFVPPAPPGQATAATPGGAAASHSYFPDGKANGAKMLRKSLTKLAHRFVPGAVAKPGTAARPALSNHTFLPAAPAKNGEKDGVPTAKEGEQETDLQDSTPEAVTPTKDQEELSKWFNHTWDPNNHSRLQQPKHATTDAEHFVDAKEDQQRNESFTSAQSGESPGKQQPLMHALSERITAPGGMLSCLVTPPRTPRRTISGLPAQPGGADPASAGEASRTLVEATPRAAARAKAAAEASAAAQKAEAEALLQLRKGDRDSLQLVLEAVQRVIQLEGNPEWTSQQLAKLRSRADQLDTDEAFAAHIATANLLASMGCHEEAIACYEAGLAHKPANAKAWFRYGIALFSLQRYLDAEGAYQRAIQEVVVPRDARLLPKIYVNLGIALEADGRLLAACDSYREAIRLNGDHFRAMKLLGSALYALGDLQAAEAALRASLAICPSYADASCDLGCVLCARQHLEEAKLAFKDAIIMQPKHIEAHFNLGNVYRQLGIFEAAVHCYGMLLELAPGHWRALLNLSVALAGLGRNHEAHKALRASFKASGYSGRVAAEIDKLKAMARRKQDRAQLSALMDAITDRATVAVAVKPDKPEAKKLWAELPRRGLSGFLRRPSAVDAAESLALSLDEGLLQQLQPIAQIHPYRLEAQVTEDGFLANAESPDPGTGGAGSQQEGRRVQGVAVAEAVLRRLLQEAPLHRFQHFMRVVLNEFMLPLDTSATGRQTDVGLVLALLAAVSSGDAFERADAVHALLRWRSSQRTGIPQSSVDLYIAGLKAVYGREHNMHALQEAMRSDDCGAIVPLKDFQEQLKAAFPAFDMLPTIATGK